MNSTVNSEKRIAIFIIHISTPIANPEFLAGNSLKTGWLTLSCPFPRGVGWIKKISLDGHFVKSDMDYTGEEVALTTKYIFIILAINN